MVLCHWYDLVHSVVGPKKLCQRKLVCRAPIEARLAVSIARGGVGPAEQQHTRHAHRTPVGGHVEWRAPLVRPRVGIRPAEQQHARHARVHPRGGHVQHRPLLGVDRGACTCTRQQGAPREARVATLNRRKQCRQLVATPPTSSCCPDLVGSARPHLIILRRRRRRTSRSSGHGTLRECLRLPLMGLRLQLVDLRLLLLEAQRRRGPVGLLLQQRERYNRPTRLHVLRPLQ
mmetsp:Transcript_12086/g.30462  ORF Transcript_12086/g.30462 Transcript_12086/m.30462 type:complete len:231 (-) Transcript_12086:1042-1734(-)